MKFGDKLHGQIEAIDEKGRGLFTYALPQTPGETRTVAVPFTAVGDSIEATFAKRDQGKWIAKLDKVEQPSPSRIAAPCPHAGVCGGCLWQHMAYGAQLTLKRDMINAAFAKAGHTERIENVIPCPDTLHYRNRMDYVVSWKSELGLKEYGSWNRYLDLSTCLLLDNETPKILEISRALIKDLGLVPWDAKRHEGQMRYVVIRLGRNTKERMILFVVKDLASLGKNDKDEIKKRLSPYATTLLIGENPEITDVSYVKTYELLAGKEYLEEEVNGVRYIIHPNSFFQTNTVMAATLQDVVLDCVGVGLAPTLPDPEGGYKTRPYRILDLYCGLGFFGIAAAKKGAEVFGMELDAAAIELAKINAEKNGVEKNTRFLAGAVESFDWTGETPDAVIIDPPRAGLHPKALATILEKRPPTLVYVSCNYHSLAKELAALKTVYRVEQQQALDLFPQTPHVEVVTKLVRL